jgi:hypothetical protein
MDVPAGTGDSWEFHPPRAELRAGRLAGWIDVSRPQLGVSQLAIDGELVAGQILGVRPECDPERSAMAGGLQLNATNCWRVADTYVRGGDLVATYEPIEYWPYTTQIYWSVLAGEPANAASAAVSLFVSLQTHLLETWPKLHIHTRLIADETKFLSWDPGRPAAVQAMTAGRHALRPSGRTCCILQRLAGTSLSYAEIMPTSDFRGITVWRAADNTCSTCWELFADFLEKGVIRRARMQSFILPSKNDTAAATALCQEIEQRPLPLTT